ERNAGRDERLGMLEPGHEGPGKSKEGGAQRRGDRRPTLIPKPQIRRRRREQEPQEERNVPAGVDPQKQRRPNQGRAERGLGVSEQRLTSILVGVPQRQPSGGELRPGEAEPGNELPDRIRKSRRLQTRRRKDPGPRPATRFDVARK